MPILIPQGDKIRVIQDFLRLARAYLFPKCTANERLQLATHLEWMKQNKDALVVACRFETSADNARTRFIFEAYFQHQVKSSAKNVAA